MKTLLTTLITICVFTLSCSAQWTASGTDIYNSNTGNVGIGTTSPNRPLQIDNDGSIAQIALHDNTLGASGAYWLFQNGNGDFHIDQTTNASGFLTSLVDRFRITSSGSVGVGTSAPGLKTHIVGLLGFPETTGTAQTGVLRLQGTGSNGVLDFSVNGGLGASLQATSQISLSSNFPLMLNPNGGNIGIGTTSPIFKIDAALGSPGSSTNFGYNIYASALSSVGYSGYNMQLDNSTANASGYLRLARTSGTAYLGTELGSQSRDGIRFLTGETIPAEVVRISAGGKVGIGTTTPDQALTVNGQVHSTSVVVTSTVPADYVFNTAYYLRPLADVKAFVDKNHHLPEVPSAAEFKKDGQNLGEMNMTLLKKVEELTLYLIDKDKKEKEQEGRINKLEKQLAELVGKIKTQQ